ncbi:hypothetical protein IMZ29_01030 [Achromobacter sp. GG226]|uniref:hypothetical protein n=1 Tax=Verticiella alkaliphila TaxID=2779529 RepID=UPI001C0CDABA|nr:hypothetical protein [Verticiella sp. GG226]MBU4609187.1 hypothetical protein [Verticiella sp. GG226]
MTDQNDRELLELAAKAIGLDAAYDEKWGGMLIPVTVHAPDDGYEFWNPLEISGDAFDLAARLRLGIDHNHAADQQRWVSADRNGCEGCYSPVSCVEDEFDECDRLSAARRAVVRAAAEIAKGFP